MVTHSHSKALDRLYSASLTEFVPLRKQLVTELRGAGEADAAKQMASAAKPTRTTWALNQVARQQPELLRSAVVARESAARDWSGDAGGRSHATQEYRQRVSEVVRAARERLAEAGLDLDAAQARRIAETLQVACAQEGETRARLFSGTLTRDEDAEDPFAGLVAPAAPQKSDAPKENNEHEVDDERGNDARQRHEEERRKREEKEREQERLRQAARDRVAELQEAAHDLREKAKRAEAAVTLATREAHEARLVAEEAEARLEAAKDAYRGMR